MNFFRKRFLTILPVILSFLSITPYSYAWDGTVTGYINTIEVTDAENYAFRITFTTGEKFCGNSTWAYINKSDSNYETYVSALLTAKMARQPVTIYTLKQSSGLCKIGYMVLR